MGILISKQVTILGTIILNGLYIRLEVRLNREGNTLVIENHLYPSKEAYDANPGNRISVQYGDDAEADLQRIIIPYDRDRDGVDILKFAHTKVIEFLTTDITEEKTVLNEKDEEVVVTEVVREKFSTETETTSDLKEPIKEEETKTI